MRERRFFDGLRSFDKLRMILRQAQDERRERGE
jgi:hypothetical protein